MAHFVAYKERGITRDITVYKGDGTPITLGPNDKIRATIGRVGRLGDTLASAKLTVTSGTNTANGSSFTKGGGTNAYDNRLRLDAADLEFSPGQYTLIIDYFDNADSSEWKMVSRQVFTLLDVEDGRPGGVVDVSEVLLELGLAVTTTETELAMVQAAVRKAEAAVKRYLKYDPVWGVRTEFYPQHDITRSSRVAVWEANDTQAFLRHLGEAGSIDLQLRHLPVREADADGNNTIDLRIDYDGRNGTRDGSFAAATQVVEGTDFWPNYTLTDSNGYGVCEDGILRSEGLWPMVSGSVKAVYPSGYTADELRGQAVDANGTILVDGTPIYESVVDEATRRFHKGIARAKKNRVGFVPGAIESERLGDYNYKLSTAMVDRLVGSSVDVSSETAQKLTDGGFVNYGVLAM